MYILHSFVQCYLDSTNTFYMCVCVCVHWIEFLFLLPISHRIQLNNENWEWKKNRKNRDRDRERENETTWCHNMLAGNYTRDISIDRLIFKINSIFDWTLFAWVFGFKCNIIIRIEIIFIFSNFKSKKMSTIAIPFIFKCFIPFFFLFLLLCWLQFYA